jgi:hypothetical protein
MVGKIEKSLLTAICYCISKTVEVFGGRVTLVGDTWALFRLIFALSTNQAVLHVLLLTGCIEGR